MCTCEAGASRVSPCVDDMPVINLWPHLYATAGERSTDKGRNGAGGVEKRMVLSERDVESVRRARLHEALGVCRRSPAMGCR